MFPQTTQSVSTATHLFLPCSILPPTTSVHVPKASRSIHKTTTAHHLNLSNQNHSRRLLFQPLRLRCALSVAASDPTTTNTQLLESNTINKPFPAEVSRTIMELSSVATLSTLTLDGSPLAIGVRFAVDPEGTPVLCFNPSNTKFAALRTKSSLHVQLEQCGLRTPQCTIQGSLDKPEDRMKMKKLQSIWRKKFEEEVDEDLIYIFDVERVLQIEDFMEDGVWFTSSDYKKAIPDPLRDSAENIVHELNTHNMEDIYRFCNIYVDMNFQASEAKMVWVDRLGFDMRLSSPQKDVFEVRIPFPREVADEKGAKSSFNCLSQLAWEMEKNYHVQDYKKVKQLKKITCRGH